MIVTKNLQDLDRALEISKVSKLSEAELIKQHKLTDSEFRTLKDILGREPTFAELGVFSAMWSEHCSYKSSRVHLKKFPTTGEQVVVGPGENAGVVRLDGKLCVAFKMESHNHPSYLEPYQGAATGVGGILRDVFCMGARPIANLNCLRFGRRDHPRTRYLVDKCVKGIGDYGNCVGIPTVGGSISFDSSYDGNCLVNAMTVGLINDDEIFKGYASGVGNLLIYVGSATGRDGIHGATMASDSFDDTAESEDRGAVQVGDPFMEKCLLEATLEVLKKGLVVGLQDMGAAGLTSSSFEMADRAASGLYVDLDRIPVRTENMSAYELLLSESQERMLMVIKPENLEAIQEVFEKWQLAHDVIGVVTDTQRVQGVYRGKLEIDIPVAPITESAPRYERPIEAAVIKFGSKFELPTDLKSLVVNMLGETGSKNNLYRQYDRHIGTQTVLSSDEGGAAVLWIQGAASENLGLAIAADCVQEYCAVDSRLGGSYSVLKNAREIAAAGGEPLAITDCLNYGNPENPQVMGQFADGVEGIGEACHELNTPVVSGNVSLYNETSGQSIKPTPMIGMVGRLKDVRRARPAVITDKVVSLWLLRRKNTKPSGCYSLAAACNKTVAASFDLPEIDWSLEREALKYLRESDAVVARSSSRGGLILTILKMILDSNQESGFNLDLKLTTEELFCEGQLQYVLGFTDDQAAEMRSDGSELELVKLGSLNNSRELRFGDLSFDRSEVKAAFNSCLEF